MDVDDDHSRGDDDYEDDDVCIMMQCFFVTKNDHFLSARDARQALPAVGPLWPSDDDGDDDDGDDDGDDRGKNTVMLSKSVKLK